MVLSKCNQLIVLKLNLLLDKNTLEKAATEKERLNQRRQYMKRKFQLLEQQATLGTFLITD